MALIELAFLGRAVCALVGAWLVSVVVYRRLIHPLSKIPGPFLNAVSPFPITAALVRGRGHAYVKRLHERYGPIVRVSPYELSFCGANAWDDIYGFRPGKDRPEKDALFLGGPPRLAATYSLLLAGPEDHARQRKALAYPFSNTAVLQQEAVIQFWVTKLMQALARRCDTDEPVADMSACYAHAVFDIIGDLCFAEPFGCIESDQNTAWAESVIDLLKCGGWEQATRRIAGSNTWLQRQLARYLIPEKYHESRLTHLMNSKQKLQARMADPHRDHKDFMHFILKNNEAKNLLTPEEILINSAVFIGAGSETTATMLSGWTYLILMHKEAYEKLVAEIRGAFKSANEITWSATNDLPYLGACIQESLRLFPPVATGLLRSVPASGISIDGLWVPGGVTVSVAPWAASHLPLNFTRPEAFLPERWLDPDMFPTDNPRASQPFSLGPRGCIGKSLSSLEQRLIICHLLWHFDLELEGGTAGNWKWDRDGDMKNMRVWLIWEKPELMVRLTKVEK